MVSATVRDVRNVKLGSKDEFDTPKEIQKTHTDELVIALCGPIGSPLHTVANALKKRLETEFGYDECKILRLSDFITEHSDHDYDGLTEFKKIKQYIQDGDDLREEHGCGILAELAIAEIAHDREVHRTIESHRYHKPRRYCHIIDSVKNQEELDILKLVYGDMLYTFGVFSPITMRQKNLEKRVMSLKEIHELIDQDSGEELEYGQTVRNTFPQSDFFLRIDKHTAAQIENKIERFLQLILGTKIQTPTIAETAMYMADSAASNSACLSRQVGAAITDSKGELLSVGWNDVPQPFGGLYMTNLEKDPISEKDQRCWNKGGGGYCSNDEQKDKLAGILVKELISAGFLNKDDSANAESALVNNQKLRGLIEFSRSVHAEMHAIINAGHSAGDRIKEGKLFCTTFPCHSCARHIIAAGISEVHYIEPYRKSLATDLHDDAITEDENDQSKVRIIPFEGVAPSSYSAIFRVKQDIRKSKGKVRPIDTKNAMPRQTISMESMTTLESMVVKGLEKKNLIIIDEV